MKLRMGDVDEVDMSAAQIRRAADFAANCVKSGSCVGLVVVAARRGVVVLQETFGRLSHHPDSPEMPVDAIFPLASQTKPLTATLALCLVEDGLLSVSHPVQDYLPEFVGPYKDQITIHHLLTHTAGFTGDEVNSHIEHRKGSAGILPAPDPDYADFYDSLHVAFDAPVTEKPGEVMLYCDHNYWFLGEIIRRVSGQSLDDFARERLFSPLGMEDSYYETPERVRSRLVDRPDDAPCAEGIRFWVDNPVGSDGAISTAMDMLTFGSMFLNRGTYDGARVLSPASVALMTSNRILGVPARYGMESFREANWGYGWTIRGLDAYPDSPALCSPETFSHGGAGFVNLHIDPRYELVTAFFSISLEPSRIYRHPWLFVDMVTAAILDS